jgi:hypothetical protein
MQREDRETLTLSCYMVGNAAASSKNFRYDPVAPRTARAAKSLTDFFPT